jgi:aspartate kinase
MIVMKFGGSSVAGAEKIERVRKIVAARAKDRPVLVVSAFRGVTDALLDAAKAALQGDLSALKGLRETHRAAGKELGLKDVELEPLFAELGELLKGISLIRELTPRTLDYAASFGERLSARLIAAHFTAAGLPSRAVDAPDAGLITDDDFGSAVPLPEADALLKASLSKDGPMPVVTGFIGKTKSGHVTTLGRNGSDYSAAIVGAALGAREIQIWSDTDGVMTADPRMVPEARPLEELSFEEACELAYYGGKVLHPHTLVPAMRGNIPVRVLNTFKPEHPGTRIVAKPSSKAAGVKSIAFKKHQSIVSVSSPRMASGPGFLARIFSAFARHQVNVNVVATSEVTVSVTTDSPGDLGPLVSELSGEFKARVDPDKAVICVVGEGIHDGPAVAGEVFGAVKAAGVNLLMVSQGASKTNITFVVENDDVPAAVRGLHGAFFR